MHQQIKYQTLSAQVTTMCVDAVKMIFNARGASAVYSNNTLELCMRDILTINQHVMNSNRRFFQAGSLLLDLPEKVILN